MFKRGQAEYWILAVVAVIAILGVVMVMRGSGTGGSVFGLSPTQSFFAPLGIETTKGPVYANKQLTAGFVIKCPGEVTCKGNCKDIQNDPRCLDINPLTGNTELFSRHCFKGLGECQSKIENEPDFCKALSAPGQIKERCQALISGECRDRNCDVDLNSVTYTITFGQGEGECLATNNC